MGHGKIRRLPALDYSQCFVCIVCANGCRLRVEKDGDEWKVYDYQCKKGIDFAVAELTNPTRNITSTVKTVFDDYPFLPVKTNGDIPKDKIFETMDKINAVLVKERLKVGDVVIKDVFGVDIVATADLNN